MNNGEFLNQHVSREHSVQFPQSSGPLVESKSEWKAIVHPLIIVVKLFDGHRMPRAG